MKSFLGAANVYRQYIKAHSHVARPLSDMLKKDSGVEWDHPITPNEEQLKAFMALKKALSEAPLLALPQHFRPYMIDCDASKYAAGVVLL